MNKMQKGFTLVELIIVIAVIGILAGVVLVNVGGVREGANSAAVRSSMAQMRTQLENNEYDPEQNEYTSDPSGFEPDTATVWDDIDENAVDGRVGYNAQGDPAKWALAATLVNADNDSQREIYCIDSDGFNDWTGEVGTNVNPSRNWTNTDCSGF